MTRGRTSFAHFTTIQASDPGSRIDLSHLTTLAGGGYHYETWWGPMNYTTHIHASGGGEVDLAGAIGQNPSGGYSNDITLDGTASVLGVAGIASISSTTLAVNGGPC